MRTDYYWIRENNTNTLVELPVWYFNLSCWWRRLTGRPARYWES